MSAVTITNATKRYGASIILDRLSIEFKQGEFFGLLGPSGSGKTTLLRAIAGFVSLDSGSIAIDGRIVDDIPAHRREIGMVFQNYALFPHLTVAENVGFGLSIRGSSSAEIKARVKEMLALVRLEGFERRFPRELSGGQQQRIALARAMITRPKLLLLDEPLGALDRLLRQEMQVELKQIQRDIGVTAIFVTHDQEEALTLSDRIGIIHQGRLIETGIPSEIYERPSTLFSARFLGEANILKGRSDGGKVTLQNGALIESSMILAPGDVSLIVRPEKIGLFKVGDAIPPVLTNRLSGTILQVIYAGNAITYRVQLSGLGEAAVLSVFSQNRDALPLMPSMPVMLAWLPGHTIRIEEPISSSETAEGMR